MPIAERSDSSSGGATRLSGYRQGDDGDAANGATGTRRRPPARFLAGLLAVLAGCAPGPAPRAELTVRGVILISVDTLRADHLGAYGYERATSPFLDSLARRGILFENAIVQLPGTLPSHMSMFTGLYPAEHGVYPPDKVLSAQIETLPEAFRRAGFRTAGFTEGGYASGHYGFDRGFESFSDRHTGRPTDIETTLSRGLDFLSGLDPSERFFLFLHTYSVHDPYDPPEPYRSLFWEGEPPPGTFEPTGPNLSAVNRGALSVDAEQVRHLEALYDGGIRYMDSVLEAWLETLAHRGLLAETLVVVTSDHGEEFFEHGKLAHEQIYHENLHVPLIVVHPALGGGRRIPDLVQSIDLAPTLYDIAGIESSTRISGESLLPLLLGDERPGGAEAYAETYDRSAVALYQGTADGLLHLIHFRSPEDASTAWWGRAVRFDTDRSALRFQAMSFHQPRTLTVSVEGDPLTEIAIEPHWKPIDLALPASSGPMTVELKVGECLSPASVGVGKDERCLGFRVDGVELDRSELYDVVTDPGEREDLSRTSPRVSGRLARRLQEYRFQLVAPPVETAIEGELEERLKALGYLQ